MLIALNQSESLVSKSFDTNDFQVYTERHFDQIPQLKNLPLEFRNSMKAVAHILPFRVNRYVIEKLIQWQ